MSLALRPRRGRDHPAASVADGLGAPFAGALDAGDGPRSTSTSIVLLDDPTILAGLRFALERMKQVLEPAGAAALAAVLAGRVEIRDGERVAVVLSGGNVEVGRLGELLAAAGDRCRAASTLARRSVHARARGAGRRRCRGGGRARG